MLERTFQLLPGVGPWGEKDLWARGVLSWEDFDETDRWARLGQAKAALATKDLAELARLIPRRLHWRLYGAFASQACFFDIEAQAAPQRQPTVVTVFGPSLPNAQALAVFIEGRSLDLLPAHLARFPIWVTFNGSSFDLPVLKERFDGLAGPLVHIDLRTLCGQLKLKGGLKQVAERLGFPRPPHLRHLNGLSAIDLWRVYQSTKDLAALRLLVEYNAYDAIDLKVLIERAWQIACDQFGFPSDRIATPFERGEVLYDLSKLLLDL